MLAPQFSLRSILAATVVCGFVSLIGATALRGAPWARAVMLALAALVLILVIHGLMFFVMWAASLLVPRKWFPAPGQSPFATSIDVPAVAPAGQTPFTAVTNRDA